MHGLFLFMLLDESIFLKSLSYEDIFYSCTNISFVQLSLGECITHT